METLQPLKTQTDARSGSARRRRAGGRRRRHAANRRRARRLANLEIMGRRLALAVAGLAIVSGLVVLASIVLEQAGPPASVVESLVQELPASAPGLTGQSVDQQSGTGQGSQATADQGALLLIRTHPGQDVAAGLTLLTSDEVGGQSVLFMPSTSLVEIPGIGLDRIGLAQQYGGTALTVATVENALGIEISGGVQVDDRGLGTLLDRIGGATITVSDRLINRSDDGTGAVAFDAGVQQVNGIRLADYWSFQQRGETELDTFSRQQDALGALLGALGDPDTLAQVLDPLPPELSTDVAPATVRGLLSALSEAQRAGTLTVQLLPVAPFSSTDTAMGTSYQLRAKEVNALVAATMPGLVPQGGGSSALPVQVLNGVGVPGVGQRVDAALEGLPLRIVLSDNARTFDVRQTQIVVYEETVQLLAAAEQVRSALGVGTILVSRQPQSVVDLTIVVGSDFAGGGSRLPKGL